MNDVPSEEEVPWLRQLDRAREAVEDSRQRVETFVTVQLTTRLLSPALTDGEKRDVLGEYEARVAERNALMHELRRLAAAVPARELAQRERDALEAAMRCLEG